jgi:hypothetical protein
VVGRVVAATLVLAGLVHLLPAVGLIGTGRLEALYGVAVSEPNLEILLRHRAVLFGGLGLLMLYAAARPHYRVIAVAGGLLSVLSFLCLALVVGGYNEHLARVVTVDVLALVLLLAAAILLAVSRGARSRTPMPPGRRSYDSRPGREDHER